MAYKLEFVNSENRHVVIPDLLLQSGDVVTIVAETGSVNVNQYIIDSDLSSRLYLIGVQSSGAILINTSVCTATLDGSPITSGTTPYPEDGLEHTFVLNVTANCSITDIGQRYTGVDHFEGFLKSIRAERGATTLRDYSVTSSFGQGVLIDDASGNDGAPINFPANLDDALIFYDDGGSAVTADVAYTVNAPTFASSASVTLPQPVTDSAFSIASPSFSASANASLPQPIADVAFTISAPTFSASASASVPSGDLYYLQFDGVDDYVESSIPTLTQPFSVEVDCVINGDGSYDQKVFELASGDKTEYLGVMSDAGAWKIYSNGKTPGNSGAVSFGERLNIRLEVSGDNAALYVNNTLVYDVSPSSSSFLGQLSMVLIGRSSDLTNSAQMNLYGVTVKESGATVNNYDPTASNGTGQVLPDTVGGNNGALVNFPTDDSQWIQYAFAAPIADANFTLNAPVFTVSANATLPQPSASIAYSVYAPSFAADATVTLPNPTTDVIYTINSPTFSVSATTIETGAKSNLLFSVSKPLFSANAAVTLPDAVAKCNISIPTPSFSISCSVPAPRLQPRKTISVTGGRGRVISAGPRAAKTIRVN